MIDISGERFGSWVVIDFHGKVKGSYLWNCRCDCGLQKPVASNSLRHGKSTKCFRCAVLKNTKQGGSSHPLNSIYKGMVDRCHNPNSKVYDKYGGRGVYVCDRWRYNFDLFCKDIGERPSLKHSIDRIDNNGNYSPINCRWATAKQQARNRKSNRLLIYNGEEFCLSELSEISGISGPAISKRLNLGWSVKEAVEIKIVKTKDIADRARQALNALNGE